MAGTAHAPTRGSAVSALIGSEFEASAAAAETSVDARFRHLLGAAAALTEQARPQEAEPLLRLALRLRPGSAPIVNSLGAALFDLGRFDEALDCFRQAARLDPTAAGAFGNAGMVLKTLDRFDEALAAYDSALAIAPDDGQLRLNRAVALLRAGRMAEAWPDYESRLMLRCRSRPPDNLLPTLGPDGPDLHGRKVLVLHEEGFGDTLQFIRYAALLAARGARVSVAVPDALVRVLSGVAGIDDIVALPADPAVFDYACPVFSLPRAFATELHTIPRAVPYLTADPALIARWAGAVAWRDPARLRVGLVWAGQARPWLPGFAALDARRSAGLAALAPLAALDVEFVSLQKGADISADAWPCGALHDPMPLVQDFADTAAVIAQLDAVVSVDTAVVHLAGGMGKPVLMLDRADACWRWLSGRSDSPWYPTLRICRQSRPGDWSDAVRDAGQALTGLAAAKRRLIPAMR